MDPADHQPGMVAIPGRLDGYRLPVKVVLGVMSQRSPSGSRKPDGRRKLSRLVCSSIANALGYQVALSSHVVVRVKDAVDFEENIAEDAFSFFPQAYRAPPCVTIVLSVS